ncbi:MAG: hypothetical protein ACYTF1_22000, partial [Planctomycetota bacterium]
MPFIHSLRKKSLLTVCLTCALAASITMSQIAAYAAPPASKDKAYTLFRFDCGTASSPVKPGWKQITEKTVYKPEKGYGWLTEADESFDATSPFIPKHLEDFIKDKPKPGDMTRDGVIGKQDMTFHANLPDGKYWLAVTIGSELRTRRNMSVYIGDRTIAEKITTRTSWGGYATYQTFRQTVRVTGGNIKIDFKHQADGNSVLGIELIPYVPYPISFQNSKWQSSDKDQNLQDGLKALNHNDGDTAQKSFNKIECPILKAAALACVADLLDIPEPQARAILQPLHSIMDNIMQTSPNTRNACIAYELKRVIDCYLTSRYFLNLSGYTRAIEETAFSFSRRMQIAIALLQQISPEDPLYNRACLNLGRIHYWYAREGGTGTELADKYLGVLKKRQPNNRLVRIYNGEKIPWGQEYTAGAEGMPQWAVKQREAMGRLMAVLHWWINNRQLDTGELGGGYGDDVEMLRQWHVYLGGADDATIKLGWKRLAHGAWFSSRVLDQCGYYIGLSDVQHTAEPMSDSHPALIGLDYGNPVWIERCMATMRMMRDTFTAINKRGHRHFRSMWFSAKEISPEKKWASDVPCCGRATRPGLWLGWYQQNPEVVKFFREWMDAWTEDIMRAENGKPAGIMPTAITFEEDRIGGQSDKWWW